MTVRFPVKVAGPVFGRKDEVSVVPPLGAAWLSASSACSKLAKPSVTSATVELSVAIDDCSSEALTLIWKFAGSFKSNALRECVTEIPPWPNTLRSRVP